MIDFNEELQAFIKWAVRNQYDVSQIDTVDDALFKRQSTEDAWMGWISSAKAKAEKLNGCVMVPKDQIEVWWQDSEEPENFATTEDGLSFIAQHIQDDEVMEINEHHTVHLPSVTKFGAWVYQNGQRKFFVGTKDEVEAAKENNHE